MRAMRSPRVMLAVKSRMTVVAVRFAEMFDFENMFAAGAFLLELDVGRAMFDLASS